MYRASEHHSDEFDGLENTTGGRLSGLRTMEAYRPPTSSVCR